MTFLTDFTRFLCLFSLSHFVSSIPQHEMLIVVGARYFAHGDLPAECIRSVNTEKYVQANAHEMYEEADVPF